MPRAEIKLRNLIKKIYNAPFRGCLSVLYATGNSIRFSKNRLAKHDFSDFSLLEDPRYSFKLNFDEIVFNLVWQAADDFPNPTEEQLERVKAAVVTNERIVILDARLTALRYFKITQSLNFVTSAFWMAHTLLYTTERHLHYLTLQGDLGTLYTFNGAKIVICDVLADRVVVANRDKDVISVPLLTNPFRCKLVES